MDYYQILGVDKSANEADIKNAFRKLAKQHHPDAGGDPEQFKKINEAYTTLSDPQKRHEYDNPNPFQGNPGFSGRDPFFRQGPDGSHHFEFNNLDDFFRAFSGGAGFHPSQYAPPRNKDLRMRLSVDIESTIAEQTRTVNLNTGNSNKVVQIPIPAGVSSGTMMRFKGYGQDIVPNAPPGDLVVDILVEDSKMYARYGKNNVLSKLRINALDAVTGVEIPFRTIHGKTIKVNIPKGTQHGTKLRIAGQGLPTHTNSQQVGDQYLEILLETPILNDKQIELINQAKQTM